MSVKDLCKCISIHDKSVYLAQDFFISVLDSSATKREARSYLKRFVPSKSLSRKDAKSLPAKNPTQEDRLHYDPAYTNSSGVSLGSFYAPIRSVGESPVFTQQPKSETQPQQTISE